MTYQTPSITELGSVAAFTQQDHRDFDFDGHLFRGDKEDPQPTS